MRTVLKISTILSWFNLVTWGFIVLLFLMAGLLSQQLLIIIVAFLMCANVLHSYAALQLHQSIRSPAKSLSNQTPAGIRFIGVIAALAGIVSFSDGAATLQNSQEILKTTITQYPQMKGVSVASVQMIGIFVIILGISLVVNVLLNFRLLRWYHFMKGMM
jgi:hypothetical protein